MGTSLRGQRRQDSPVPRPPYPTPTRQALGAAGLQPLQTFLQEETPGTLQHRRAHRAPGLQALARGPWN